MRLAREWIWAGMMLAFAGEVWAQERTPVVVPEGSAPVAQAAVSPVAPVQAAAKGKKAPYTGPDTVVELAPTPMLDEEGKQRLDPEGKPMFNAAVKQQRDKKGHPLFDESGKPVMQTAKDLGYDERGKKLKVKKEKEAKTVSVGIVRGTLTVDGMIAKAGLNYQITNLKYIYFSAPWVGTVVVSNVMFPGAKEQARAFDQRTLTVTVDEHMFQLYSDNVLLGKGKKPEPAYVLVNRDFQLPSKMPVMGYGTTLRPPYAWPGAKENVVLKGNVVPPPVPASLRPTLALSACPSGQMRAARRPVLPGEAAVVQPCVAIAAAKAGSQPQD